MGQLVDHCDFETKIANFERLLANEPDALFGDGVAPLEHFFADGMYIRKITMPAGLLVTSARHKTRHPFFVFKGRLVVADGRQTTVIRAT